MKITLKSGILLIVSVCVVRFALDFIFFSYEKINENTFYNIIEIASGITFSLIVLYLIAKNRSDIFQKNTFAVACAIVIATTANGFIKDYKEHQTIKAVRSNAVAAIIGGEIKDIGMTSSNLVNAINELFKITNEERQNLDINEEAIQKLFPQTLELEIFTSDEKLSEAKRKIDEIEKLTNERVEFGKNWFQKNNKLIEQLEIKYKIKMDKIKNELLRGKENTEKYFMPVQNEMLQMVVTVKELHEFAMQQKGSAEIKNGQIFFESDGAVKKFNKLSLQLQNENEKLKQLQIELSKHTEKIIDSVENLK